MTNIDSTIYELIQQWASASADPDVGDPIVSTDDISDWVQSNMDNIGVLVFDKGDLPDGSDERAQVFFTEADLLAHWISSGLIYFDANGDVQRNDMLQILVEEGDDGNVYYTVYVHYE